MWAYEYLKKGKGMVAGIRRHENEIASLVGRDISKMVKIAYDRWPLYLGALNSLNIPGRLGELEPELEYFENETEEEWNDRIWREWFSIIHDNCLPTDDVKEALTELLGDKMKSIESKAKELQFEVYDHMVFYNSNR